MEKIVILGSSGSIGRQSQEIILDNSKDFELVGVSVGHNIDALKNTLRNFNTIRYVTVLEYEDYLTLKEEYPNITFFYGDQGLLSLIDCSSCDMVVNALVGFVGFLPSFHCVSKGIDLALANKESLVVGGNLIKEQIKLTKAKLYAIDSEHCALDKCLEGKNRDDIANLIITASGGSFRDYPLEELNKVTIEDALKHPSWKMGNKITIDSATMMNKGFEIIEAMHLFDFSLDQIKVLLHDESLIHSLVEFKDHSFLADLGPADMKIAISYALYKNHRKEIKTKELKLEDVACLHFRKMDIRRYPCLELAYRSIKEQGTSMVCLNRSNEEAVYSFLKGEIKFTDISKVISFVLDKHQNILKPTVDDIIKIDKWAKDCSKEIIRRLIKC